MDVPKGVERSTRGRLKKEQEQQQQHAEAVSEYRESLEQGTRGCECTRE